MTLGSYKNLDCWWEQLFPILQSEMMSFGENEINFSLLACTLDDLWVDSQNCKSKSINEMMRIQAELQRQDRYDELKVLHLI